MSAEATDILPEPVEPTPMPRTTGKPPLVRAFYMLASLRLTVVLLAMAVFLVFVGTLAQVDKGIWTVVQEYFREGRWFGFAWIDFQVFFPRSWQVGGGFPFPSGWMIGLVMLVNLIAAHSVRFKIKAKGRQLQVGLAVTVVGALLTWLVISSVFDARLSDKTLDPTWRILWQLIKGGGASLVLLLGCVFLFHKRAGIVMIHAGIILMMFSELITGTSAEESHMRITEGQAMSHAVDQRSAELAFIDPSDPEYDRVTVIPGSRLASDEPITHEKLPFVVEPVRYYKNSGFVGNPPAADLKNPETNPATKGYGLEALVVEKPEVSGVAADQGVDIPSAYVRLRDKSSGEDLGVYLFSLHLKPHELEVDGKTYQVALRFKRNYLFSEGSDSPYRIELIDFQHKKYLGTNTPKDFSSYVRVIDPDRQVDRKVRIWMNNPMRYADHIFYQASFDRADDRVTTLQVVRNTSWMIPYVALMMTAIGLLAHFGLTLAGFLKKRRAAA